MRRRDCFTAAFVELLALCVPMSGSADGLAVVLGVCFPWFSGREDGGYAHCAQNGHAPPVDIASNFYPADGPYSSSNSAVIATQLNEAARAGIDELAVSWWGRGSKEDKVLPDVLAGAVRTGMLVAAHIEPYNGRTVASVAADAVYLHSLGVRTIYVYQAFAGVDPADWAAANDAIHAEGVTTFAETALVGQAAAGHFSGIYTYDTVTYGGRVLSRLCKEAHAVHLLCAPSVGPGYDARRAIGDPHVKPRRHGLTYDSMWRAALAAGADRITITSFNEWQEGTQIEPASAVPVDGFGYGSYDGAWGRTGAPAETAYLARTAWWARLFTQPPRPFAARPRS